VTHKISSFFTPLRYPGGKGKLALFIKAVLEANDLNDVTYVEPYAGGAGIAFELLFHGYAKQVLINDISRSVSCFWHSILHETDAFCDLIDECKVDMRTWREQRRIHTNPSGFTDLEIGFATFFLNRTNRSGILDAGVIGGQKQLGPWKLDARFNKNTLVARIKAIAAMKERIEVSRMDALDFLRTVNGRLPASSLVYLDPPYFKKGQELYTHSYDFSDHADVAYLTPDLLRHRNWIVSYDDVPEVRALYHGYRSITYSLAYSAQDRYRGTEAMFFSPTLLIPDLRQPMRRAA
jgi:DNA adenine methylase